MSLLLAAACAAGAAALVPRPQPRAPARAVPVAGPVAGPVAAGPVGRRPVLAAGAGLGSALFVGGPLAPVGGLVAAAVAWWLLGRVEPRAERVARETAARDLPHLVQLVAAALRAGASAGDAVRLGCAALPGPAADRLAGIPDRLALGVDPGQVWGEVGRDPTLAPLGRALGRAHETGAPVVAAVERLADELGRTARAGVEERARAVGVRAALPLGLCLLPSFLLLGIVPVVAGLVTSIT